MTEPEAPIMNNGLSGLQEPGSPFYRSASAAAANGMSKNGNGKSKSTSKLYRRNRSLSFSTYSSPPPQKNCKRLGCSTCGHWSASETGSTFVFACSSDVGPERRENSNPLGKTNLNMSDAQAIAMFVEKGSITGNLGEDRELNNGEARCILSEAPTRQYSREETRQHKTSEKVSQWLQNSYEGSMTGVAALPSAVGNNIRSELATPKVIDSSGPSMEDTESYTVRCSDSNLERVTHRSSRLRFAVPACIRVWSSGLRTILLCGIRYSLRHSKLVSLPVLILGLYLQIRYYRDEDRLPPT
ncbi:hypothetical protein R1flu_006685 [Riccia fluitans]|uniref:Uncharacterized protein n=1 Tax=Riccia fluitans TaxID=41844 RepID=A0ABD1YWQ0_9MARC